MLKRPSIIAASLALAASIAVTGFDTAEAGHYRRHRGAFVGGAALGLFALGAMSAQSGYHGDNCYRGRPECRWVRRGCYRDRYGDYECEESYRECYRPLYCD